MTPEHPTVALLEWLQIEVADKRNQLTSREACKAAANHIILLQAVVDAARDVHTLHMTVTSMTAPPEFYDALWKIAEALRALDGAPGQGG